MSEFFRTHPAAKWAGIVAATVLIAIALFLALFDWNLLKPTLARRITAASGRETTLNGDLKVHLWSWNPSAEVNGLEMKNPAWADRPVMFGAKRITVALSLGRLLRGQVVLPLLDLEEPAINLERDSKGRASWELGTPAGTPTKPAKPARLPTVQRLIIAGGQLHVVDEVRKLTFSGSLVAAEQAGQQDPSAFKIRCSGTLNAKPFRLEANGGPLLNLTPNNPYTFQARIIASDINLETQVTVPKPFDLRDLNVKFDLKGNDLADVFYLTGLALPNTPKYELAATVVVAGTKFSIDDLKGKVGSSDLSGRMEIDISGQKPKLTANLASVRLNIVDLAPTLGQSPPKANSLAHDRTIPAPAAKSAASKPTVNTAAAADRLLPDADLQVNRLRGMNADVKFRADSVSAPKVPMKHVDFHVVLNDGVLNMNPLAFVLDAGQFTGKVQIDARQNDPLSDIDMRIDKIDLSQFKSATMKQSPIDGTMLGRFQFHGRGSSVHKLAAGSNGIVSIVIPHGDINAAIAELTGINVLKGLGLLLAKQQQKAEIRCGIIDFKDHDGTLDTTTVYIDTSNVLITGRGHINLGSEAIELALAGDPKKFSILRLRSPIAVGGTMLHPTFGVQPAKLAGQAGAAVALGTLLTPVAAALAFVDPGLAKDKDCSTVLAQAKAGVSN
ncbi:MAG: AsmA family protein [Steroidobacteraceae bacterium]